MSAATIRFAPISFASIAWPIRRLRGKGSAAGSFGFLLDDLSNGTGLATSQDTDTVECDPFSIQSHASADIIWVVDESGSMDDNRQDIVNKIRRGRCESIRPCLSCHTGCLTHPGIGGETTCSVNPAIAREAEMALTPTMRKKKVVVVGGGPAGMEAARVASMRGHDVVLFEKRDRLGGALIPAGVPWFKQDDGKLLDWYLGEMERNKIEVRLNTEVKKAIIDAEDADSVVFATGASPNEPSWLEGGDRPNVHLAEDVLMQPDILKGDTIAVIGDGALTGGMAYEALNHIAVLQPPRLIIVVNDNGRSYAPTVGGIAALGHLRFDPRYEWTKKTIGKILRSIPAIGEGADELVFLDITATHEAREIVTDMVRRVADTVFIPFTVGGGIGSLNDMHAIISTGADKVSVNTAAVYSSR